MSNDNHISSIRKGKVTIEGQPVHIQSWVSYDFNRYEYVLAFQVSSSGAGIQRQDSRIRISREFVDDCILDNAGLEHVAKVNQKMLDIHLEDILDGKKQWSGNRETVACQR